MMTLKIAFRNIFRQKRRTILTALTMFAGFTLAAISIGWADGTYSYIIDMFTRNRIGHIQVHNEGYLDKPSLYKTIPPYSAKGETSYDVDYESIGQTIQSVEGVESWAPRVYSTGLASVGEKSAGVKIVGIEPQREVKTTRFDKKITAGDVFSKEPSHEAILGKGLAKILDANIGQEIVIVSQGADGSIANDQYKIVGIAESGDETTDRMTCYLHIKDAQELLVLEGRIHEIVVVASGLGKVNKITKAIKMKLADSSLDVEPWQEVAKSFYRAMQADKEGMWIMLFVIILVVAVGVLNTALMSALERTREYGVLKAVGTKPTQIFRLVLYEVNIIAIACVLVGGGFSLLINHLLSIHGITLPEPFSYGGMEFTRMCTVVNARSLYIPAITVIASATLVSLFPAIKAARIVPAKAMRIH